MDIEDFVSSAKSSIYSVTGRDSDDLLENFRNACAVAGAQLVAAERRWKEQDQLREFELRYLRERDQRRDAEDRIAALEKLGSQKPALETGNGKDFGKDEKIRTLEEELTHLKVQMQDSDANLATERVAKKELGARMRMLEHQNNNLQHYVQMYREKWEDDKRAFLEVTERGEKAEKEPNRPVAANEEKADKKGQRIVSIPKASSLTGDQTRDTQIKNPLADNRNVSSTTTPRTAPPQGASGNVNNTWTNRQSFNDNSPPFGSSNSGAGLGSPTQTRSKPSSNTGGGATSLQRSNNQSQQQHQRSLETKGTGLYQDLIEYQRGQMRSEVGAGSDYHDNRGQQQQNGRGDEWGEVKNGKGAKRASKNFGQGGGGGKSSQGSAGFSMGSVFKKLTGGGEDNSAGAAYKNGSSNGRHQRVEGEVRIRCGLCISTTHIIDEVVEVEGCGHVMCKNGLKGYIETALVEKKMPMICPICLKVPSARVGAITNDLVQVIGLPDEVYAAFIELHFQTETAKTVQIKCRRCLLASTVPKDVVDNTMILTCPSCKHEWCKRCKRSTDSLDNGGAKHSCEAGSQIQPQDSASSQAQQQTAAEVKKCPGCKESVERTENSNHFICTACQTHFCFTCDDLLFSPSDDLKESQKEKVVKAHYSKGPCREYSKSS